MHSIHLLIGGGAGDSFAIEDSGDSAGADAAEGHGKNALHNRCGLRVNLQFSLCRGVLPVSIESKGSDVLPLPALVVQHRADVVGQVLQIPLVDKAVDLAGLFVGPVVGIHMIHHRDKPDAPFNEFAMEIL